jgi:hypothetical protein
MTEAEYARKLAELNHLLNDPDVPMQPARVWELLAEIAERELFEQDQDQRGAGGSRGLPAVSG